MRHAAFGLFLAALFAAPAHASVTDVDTDGDARASFDELVAVYPDLSKDVFVKADLDSDGFLNGKELVGALVQGQVTTIVK